MPPATVPFYPTFGLVLTAPPDGDTAVYVYDRERRLVGACIGDTSHGPLNIPPGWHVATRVVRMPEETGERAAP